MSETWVGTGVAAQLLGLTAQGVRERIARGDLPARRRGKSWQIPLSALAPQAGSGDAEGAVGQLAGAMAEALAERLETVVLASVEEAIGDVQIHDALFGHLRGILDAGGAAAVEAGRKEAQMRMALSQLAVAPWWRRRWLVQRLRHDGVL
jgi:hypothetical protein